MMVCVNEQTWGIPASDVTSWTSAEYVGQDQHDAEHRNTLTVAPNGGSRITSAILRIAPDLAAPIRDQEHSYWDKQYTWKHLASASIRL
jgi:hypothetical protein